MLSGTMHALQLNEVNDLRYCDVPVPVPGNAEVLCRVESVSICGTDPHIINGEYPGFWPRSFPIIPGHEWSGVIVKLGERAGDYGWHIGDRVCALSHVGCGYCRMCLEGRYNLCLNYGRTELGHRQYGHYVQGAYAEYMCTNIKAIERVPDAMSFNIAACMDPLSIALHMVIRSKLEPGDTVLVNGSGAQGLLGILCCRSLGAGMIMVSGSGNRLEAARRLGATPIDYHSEDVVTRVLEMTAGLGAKRVIECTGTAEGIRSACLAVAKGGVISIVSLPNGNVSLPVRRLVLDEIELIGNRANPNTLAPAIQIAMNWLPQLESLITHEFPLSRFQEAFDIFTNHKENSLKVVFKPN